MFGNKNINEWDLSPSLQRKFDLLDGLVRWPTITDGLSSFKAFVKELAREALGGEVKQLRQEIAIVRAENTLLLEHLGLEIVTVGTKEIRKKVKPVTPKTAKKGKK